MIRKRKTSLLRTMTIERCERMATDPNGQTSYLGEDTNREIARLIRQDFRLTKEMGEILSQEQWDQTRDVLDIGCGPGGWLLTMVDKHPHIQAIGVDINPRMLALAKRLAKAEQISNLRFIEGDVRQPLDLPNGAFDLINARLVNSFLLPSDWPHFMQQCARLLRPGGILCVTEYEFTSSNSRARQELSRTLYQGLQHAHRSFAPLGLSVGISCMIPFLFKQAGFQQVKLKGICLDTSHGSEGFEDWREDLILLNTTFRDALIKTGVTTAEQQDALLEETLHDMEEQFCTIVFNVCVWGVKP
jgi:ubiquinone/menaquinone biosynthesis C-methylase UbiE